MEERIYTVTEITKHIKKILEGSRELTGIWIKGEIYNLTYHSSGHIYFTLKDENALISAVFFRNANKSLSFKLEEGMSVLALGGLTVFEKRGSYQVNILQVRLEGVGELQKKIEQLKKKLHGEGIFDPARKRPIPFLPLKIGVATSPTGAAVRDIIKVAMRRYPNIEIVLAPCKVQGEDAPVTIARAIEELNNPRYGIDLIIAGRGGGSFEDLMPFNEELVVRAFASSRVPIISAVGHQIDHPLSDDAADMAAPTPSAAAEMAIPMKRELIDEINYLLMRATNALSSFMRESKSRLESARGKKIFRDPSEIINMREMLLTDMEKDLLSSMKEHIAVNKDRLMRIADIRLHISNIVKNKSHRYTMALQSLEQLSPLSVMKRGYAIALNDRGAAIRSVTETKTGDTLDLLFRDGKAICSVNFIEKGDPLGHKKGK